MVGIYDGREYEIARAPNLYHTYAKGNDDIVRLFCINSLYIPESNKESKVDNKRKKESRKMEKEKATRRQKTYTTMFIDGYKIEPRADLSGANLSEADLSEANLYGADLSGAYLCMANLRMANLSGANLSEADLREAELYKADLRGANIKGARMPNDWGDVCFYSESNQPSEKNKQNKNYRSNKKKSVDVDATTNEFQKRAQEEMDNVAALLADMKGRDALLKAKELRRKLLEELRSGSKDYAVEVDGYIKKINAERAKELDASSSQTTTLSTKGKLVLTTFLLASGAALAGTIGYLLMGFGVL